MKFEDAVKSSRDYFVTIAIDLVKSSLQHQRAADRIMDKGEMVTALAEMPDEQVIRLRCTPNLFEARA